MTGDSFALGAYVAVEDRFSSRLEAALNEKAGGRVEVVNRALAALSLRDAAYLIETEARRLDADLVLATMRPGQVDERLPAASRYVRPTAQQLAAPDFAFPRRYSFLLNFYRPIVRAALASARGGLQRSGMGDARTAPPPALESTYSELLARSKAFTAETAASVVVVALRKLEFERDAGLRDSIVRASSGDPSRRGDHERARKLAVDAGVPFIDTYEAFPANSRRSDLVVFPGDDYPNAAGHAYYAAAIAAWLDAHPELFQSRRR